MCPLRSAQRQLLNTLHTSPLYRTRFLVSPQSTHPSRVAFSQNEQSCDLFSLPPVRSELALSRRTTFGILRWPIQENESRQDSHQRWANYHGSLNNITGFHTSDLSPRIEYEYLAQTDHYYATLPERQLDTVMSAIIRICTSQYSLRGFPAL